jgi:hypothetical protein
LTACETPPTAPVATSKSSSSNSDSAASNYYGSSWSTNEQKKQDFNRALDLYRQGRYDNAAAALKPLVGAPELPAALQLDVLKYAAFSHCLIGQALPCRQYFEMALAQNPSFELSKAERGHPMWGKVFMQAKFHQKHSQDLRKTRP